MIDDSVPWKVDLLRIASKLEKRKAQRKWNDRTYYLVERDVMVAAYAIRKLSEAGKLSDEVVELGVEGRSHRRTGRIPDLWDRWDFWEHYDLDNHEPVRLTLREFCNQIIHSWIWMPSSSDEETFVFDGIFVSSDQRRKQSVYFIGFETLIKTFRAVGNDDIVSMRMAYDRGVSER